MPVSSPAPQPATGAGWRPAPLVAGSLILHPLVLGAVVVQPTLWPWGLSILAVNHMVLAGAGLWPRSKLLGTNHTRLPDTAVARGEIALTIDDGPNPLVTPGVLDILDAHNAKATFFCIGERASAHPDLCRDIVRRGHAVENHSHSHRHSFSLSGPRRILRELQAAQATLAGITGQPPAFFRAPAGLRNPFLDLVLSRLGLQLASWTRRGFDTRERDPMRVLHRLRHGMRAGDILLLHDGHAARTASGQPVILEVLPGLLDSIASLGLRPVTLRQAFSCA
ncbi:polysaccharide deacetylase family protein [Thiomonas sp. FB-Cd]|uniref:polysaccharide deacetylase family protein n=1 Tax=Thiomonas sp. FB-Cd TaxID=1158292 RepID=UPI0009DF1F09|nr:polysaccharide deacetylase family protein [Thiomonas sp. FB-Cd]